MRFGFITRIVLGCSEPSRRCASRHVGPDRCTVCFVSRYQLCSATKLCIPKRRRIHNALPLSVLLDLSTSALSSSSPSFLLFGRRVVCVTIVLSCRCRTLKNRSVKTRPLLFGQNLKGRRLKCAKHKTMDLCLTRQASHELAPSILDMGFRRLFHPKRFSANQAMDETISLLIMNSLCSRNESFRFLCATRCAQCVVWTVESRAIWNALSGAIV